MKAIIAVSIIAAACSTTPPRVEPADPIAVEPQPLEPQPLVVTPPDAAPAVVAPLPPGCMRQRKTHHYRCSGVPPGPGEANSREVLVCDLCLAHADCAAKPGGECHEVGDSMCGPTRHLSCKYPDPACGGKICPEPRPIAPPSAPPSRR
jgi:hypothetical protein